MRWKVLEPPAAAAPRAPPAATQSSMADPPPTCLEPTETQHSTAHTCMCWKIHATCCSSRQAPVCCNSNQPRLITRPQCIKHTAQNTHACAEGLVQPAAAPPRPLSAAPSNNWLITRRPCIKRTTQHARAPAYAKGWCHLLQFPQAPVCSNPSQSWPIAHHPPPKICNTACTHAPACAGMLVPAAAAAPRAPPAETRITHSSSPAPNMLTTIRNQHSIYVRTCMR
jgi:hypothetical protein